VTVYERAPEPSAVGAGILLQPTGLAVLHELGLLAPLLARGARISTLVARTALGRPLFRLEYEHLVPGLFGVGVHRGALFDLLVSALQGAGAQLVAGTEVHDLATKSDRARVLGENGRALGEHDLVVIADGARSRLRAASRIPHSARPYPYGALWFVGRDEDDCFRGALSQVCEGTERMLGFLPTGFGPGIGTTPLVSLFWSLRVDRIEAVRKRGLGRWKDAVLRYDPRAAALVAQIEDPEQLLSATYLDVVMREFHRGPLVIIGDAAHATSPQLGQGTNLALLDASVLAACLAREPDVERALRRFSNERRAHVRFYAFASRWLTPVFQSDRRFVGHLRDALFPHLVRFPLLEQAMLATLAGVKRGVARRSLPLAPVSAALPSPSSDALVTAKAAPRADA
jgi:2-polyprenyl-6-methoxyphenol hydroxylase-like FAD-dependent oxidoreductase